MASNKAVTTPRRGIRDMGYSANRGRYETSLASAHRALYRAQEAAEALGDGGAAEDLQQLLQHVTALAEASLSNKVRGRIVPQARA